MPLSNIYARRCHHFWMPRLRILSFSFNDRPFETSAIDHDYVCSCLYFL
jgi:hypothetical protein